MIRPDDRLMEGESRHDKPRKRHATQPHGAQSSIPVPDLIEDDLRRMYSSAALVDRVATQAESGTVALVATPSPAHSLHPTAERP